MKNIKKKIRNLFVKLFARKLFQPFFKKLHWISLRGMNYGGGYSPFDSGELFFLNHVKNKIKDEVTILDVGANIGKYALLCNTIFESRCIIYAFEPTAFAFDTLKKKTINLHNIKSYNVGLGDSIKVVEIFYNSLGSVQSSIVDNVTTKFKESINLTTIDDFCNINQIKKIHILKIDVEGYEYNVLKGGLERINNVDYIQFEFGNKQVSSRNFLEDFINILDNFKIYRLIQDGFVEISNNPINEIFQTSNYIAINKNISNTI